MSSTSGSVSAGSGSHRVFSPALSPDRYFVRRSKGPRPLLCIAVAAFVRLLDQINRLQSTAARTWAQRFVPPQIRESVLNLVTCGGDGGGDGNDGDLALLAAVDKNRVAKFWSVLYSHTLRTISVPAELDEKTRKTLFMYLGSDLAESMSTSTLRLNIVGAFGDPERDSVVTHLRHSTLLTVFTFRRGADNDVMRVLGKHCDLLQEFNITGSTRVTDEGILGFLGLDSSTDEKTRLNPSARSLRFVKMRSTKVKAGGVRALMEHAPSLEGVRCSNYDVLQALAIHLKGWSDMSTENSSTKALSLRYLDFGPGFTILAGFLPFLPRLVEVRIGSDAPPGMKGSLQRLKEEDVGNAAAASGKDGMTPLQAAALQQLPKLMKLRTLVLKDFGGAKPISNLLQTAVGSRLTRLDVHYASKPPGIDLRELASLCPGLESLTICDSLVTCGGLSRPPLFFHLTSCKLLRVNYSDPASDWEAVPRMAPSLRVLHMESSEGMDDAALIDILDGGGMMELEEFLVIGRDNSLTEHALLALLSSRPRLRWVGDLHDWRLVEPKRRRRLLLDKGNDISGEWEGRRNEPRRKFASLGGGGGGAGGVSFNADGIVDAATATYNRDTD